MKSIPNRDLIEIKIYKYLSREYLATNLTPHIVGIYQHKICDKNILRKKCPSLQQLLTDKKISTKKDPICDFNFYNDRYQKKLHLLLLEYCPLKIDQEFKKLIKKYKSKRITFRSIEDFIYRVIFQIIFTLAHLQKKEKHFYHGDLFLRNILGISECLTHHDEYVEYNYKNKKFYLPANGFYAKISDFGTTTIAPKYISNELPNNEFYKDNKTDVFIFLRDMYDGQNMGATSLIKIAKNNKINQKDINKLKRVFNKFIDIKMIDKMNQINKKKIDNTWHIKKHPFLRKLVKKADHYLLNGYFDKYETLPKNGKIVKTYGDKVQGGGGGGDYYKYIKYKAKYISLKNSNT